MENVFQQKLGNFSATVPAGAFEQIMAEREKRRDKGFLFPFKTITSLALLFAFSLLAGNYFFSDNMSNQPNTNSNNFVPITTVEKDTKTTNTTTTVETAVTKTKPVTATSEIITPKAKATTTTTIQPKKQPVPIIKESVILPKKTIPVTTAPIASISKESISKNWLSESLSKTKLTKQISFVPEIKLKSFILADSKFNLSDKLQALPDECYSFGRQRFYSSYYLDLLYSPNYSLPLLQAKNSEYVAYKKAREKTEEYNYAFSTGLRLGLVAESGFALRVGFTYSQLTEVFNLLDKNTFREITIWETDPITGDTTGSHTETVQGELYIKHYNTHTSFGLPIYLGYQTDGEDWVLSANVGAQYNFQYKTKGKFLGTNLKPADYTVRKDDPDKAFKDQIGIELLASFGIGYKITDGMQIVLEPNLRYTLNDISTPANPIEQKYLTMGIWGGLRFKL